MEPQLIYSLARIPPPLSRWRWPAKFDRLDLAQRRVVEDVASALLRAREDGCRSSD